MARLPRSKTFDPDTIGVYHCRNRCVRRAHLMGHDKLTGRSFDHRREWVQSRLRFLAGIFAIDHLNFSIMGNHLHVLLRNRPDVRDAWTNEEVVRRWWQLFPKRREEDGTPAEIKPEELEAMLANKAWIAERRSRLGDISWFMRCLAEYIANRANTEEEISSRFWQGRFKMTRILDEAALLACAVYIDLNPIRAMMAETPETSLFTSMIVRIQAMKQKAEPHESDISDNERAIAAGPDDWLSPVKLENLEHPHDAKPTQRASNRGYLGITFPEFLAIVDWTGRLIRSDKRGSIPADLAPIFERLKINGDAWADAIKNFGRWFHTAAGRVENMAKEAKRRGQRFIHGLVHSESVFG